MEDLQRRFLKDNTDIINAIISISIVIVMFYAQLSASPQLHQKNQGMARTFASLLRVKRQRKPTSTFPQTAPPTGEQILWQKFGCISLLLQYQAKKRLDTLQIF